MRHAEGGLAETRVEPQGGGRMDERITENQASKIERLRRRLAVEVGQDRFDRYFGTQARIDVADGRVDVVVPTAFVRDLIGRRFGEALRTAANAELAAPGTPAPQIQFRVDRSAFIPATASHHVEPSASFGTGAAHARQPRPMPPPPTPRYRLEDFVVGEANRLAFSAAEQVSDPAGPRSFSPLFIHGACGLGKTHLLQGIAARWKERDPKAVIKCLTAEAFTNEYVTAVRNGRLDAFRKSYRGVDVLCIDDVHFLANKTSTQGELLHTFDAIDLDGARVALASDEHPRQIARLSAALVSRFMSGMVVKLDPPEPALRERIVAKLAERRAMRLDRTAITCLAGDLGGPPGASVRDLEGALTRVEALTRLLPDAPGGGVIGVAHVRRALGLDAAAGVGGALRGPRRPVRIDTIRDEVCRLLRVETPELMGRGRHARVVLARSVISHLARALTTMSYPEIARAMGRPNHSTIVTACKRIEGQIQRSEQPDFGNGSMGAAADIAPELLGLNIGGLCDVLKAAVLRAAWGPNAPANGSTNGLAPAPTPHTNGHTNGNGHGHGANGHGHSNGNGPISGTSRLVAAAS